MSTPYTGVAFPPLGQDAPPPLPGNAPVPNIPADADANNSATMFLQQMRILADHTAYLAAAAKHHAPTAITGTNPRGFTAVSHVGPGTGTVTVAPVGAGQTQPSSTPYSPVIKISTAGGVGVGAFQWSNDNGATYGAPVVIAATYTDPTSGITVFFSGTFTALDTYAFRPVDMSNLAHINAAGQVKCGTDHLGLQFHRYGVFREDWDNTPTTNPIVANLTPVVGSSQWSSNFNGGASQVLISGTERLFGTQYLRGAELTGAAAGRASLLSNSKWNPAAALTVYEQTIAITAGPAYASWGFVDSFDSVLATAHGAFFSLVGTGLAVNTRNGAALTTIGLAGVFSTAVPEFFRIELTATVARFFRGLNCVAEITTTLPVASVGIELQANANPGQQVVAGGVRVAIDHLPTISVLL